MSHIPLDNRYMNSNPYSHGYQQGYNQGVRNAFTYLYEQLYNMEKEASILSKNDILMICKEVFGIELDLSKYPDEDFEEVN